MYPLLCPMFQWDKNRCLRLCCKEQEAELLEITGEESLLNEEEKILCYGHCVILLRQDGLSNCSA